MDRVSTRVLVGLLAVAVAALSALARWPAAWPYFVADAFLCGGLVAVLYRRDVLTTRQVLVGAVLFRLLFLPLPPGLSDDGYRYVWDGLLQAQGINPYRYVPADEALAELHDTPLYEALNSASYYSVYPPFSQLVFRIGGWFGGGEGPASFYVIKFLFTLLELGGVWLLSRMVTPRRLMLYAWHPLVLIETAGQGHTEAALVFFLIATLWAARRGRGGWASAALAGATWTKLYPVLLFPFLWRRFGWRARHIGIAVLVSVVLWAPYAAVYVPVHLVDSLQLYTRLFEFNAGPYYALKGLFTLATGADWSKQLGPALAVLFLFVLPLLYRRDAREEWPLRRAFFITLGLFLALSTTVHPWYLLAVLPLAVMGERPSWAWLWLGLCAPGTYLLYTGGPYWVFVILGWGGWALLLMHRHSLPLLQQKRSKQKAEWIGDLLPAGGGPLRVLDLGAGEGYVGEALQRQIGTEVMLADVADLNRADLPHVVYDGRRLPFEENAFDVTVLYFVLHHCADPEQVLREALRVSRRRVIVVESLRQNPVQHRLLRSSDRLANRLRGGHVMRKQEPHLHFRTAAEWKALFARLDANVLTERCRGRWVHPQAFFALKPSGS